MSHEYYYETVMREQEYLQTKLEDYRLQKQKLEWELASVNDALDKIQNLITKIEKELGDVSHG
jgi:chaperonin cofactor prefoldin